MRHHVMPHTLRAALCTLALFCIAALPLAAQRYQETIGSGLFNGEDGLAVIEAANGDHVIAGLSDTNTGRPLAYVVRTDGNGTLLWHNTYDVDGSGFSIATDIKEYPNGDLAVVGWSQYPGGIRAFAMRLNSTGGVIWISHLQSSLSSQAQSVVIATQGNGTSTNPDDLILSGWWSDPAVWNNQDGLLARLDANGNPIWIRTYDMDAGFPYSFDGLNDVEEAQITGAGDIVATGYAQDAASVTNLWVLRVDGNTGAMGASPQGSALFSTPTGVLSMGNAIIELRNGSYNGDFAITGITNNTMNSSDILALQIAADPCDAANPRALRRLGEFVNGSADEGNDLVEITDPAVGNVGNVMITGGTKVAIGSGVQVFLQEFQVGTMVPVGVFFHYGAKQEDYGRGLAQTRNAPVSPGFVVTGFTQSPPLMLPGHFQDLYLVKVDNALDSKCYYGRLKPPQDTTYLNPSCTPPAETTHMDTLLSTQPQIWPTWGAYQVCFASPKRSEATESGSLAAMTSLDAYPRPGRRDASFTLAYTLTAPGTVQLAITDLLGRTVYARESESSEGSTTELVPTTGWSAGTYLVKAVVNGQAQSTRVVVVDR